jgi:hypothetical protein
MKRSNSVKLILIGVLAILCVALVIQARQQTGGQQQPPPGPPQGQQRPTPELKNIQVLKGMTYQQVDALMDEWEKDLGVGCNYCHLGPKDQDTPRKNVSRLMYTQFISALKHKDGSAVSCKDCHLGEPNPLRNVAFADAVGHDRSGLVALKGMPHDQVMAQMQSYTKALNIKCDYCHSGGFANDTPRKEVARYMITEYSGNLTKDGKAVTCNDCHQGRAKMAARLPRPQQPPAATPDATKKPIE